MSARISGQLICRRVGQKVGPREKNEISSLNTGVLVRFLKQTEPKPTIVKYLCLAEKLIYSRWRCKTSSRAVLQFFVKTVYLLPSPLPKFSYNLNTTNAGSLEHVLFHFLTPAYCLGLGEMISNLNRY